MAGLERLRPGGMSKGVKSGKLPSKLEVGPRSGRLEQKRGFCQQCHIFPVRALADSIEFICWLVQRWKDGWDLEAKGMEKK